MSEIGAISVKISADDAGFQSAVKRTVAGSQQASKQVAAAGNQMQGFSKAAATAGTSAGGFGNIARQAGFQVQDFVVQVQGGQSAFVAFGQQGSQLAGIFGPGGAVLGAVIALASAIGGTLVASMRAAGKEATILPEALLKRLDEIAKRYGEVDEASRQAFSQVELGKLSTEITNVTGKITRLTERNKTLAEEMQGLTPQQLQGVAAQIAKNELSIKSLSKEQQDLINLQSRLGQELVTQGGEWDEITEKVDEYAKATTGLANQLTAAEIKLTQGELAARLYAAAIATGKDSAEQLDSVLRQKIETVFALEEAQDLAAESTKRMAEQDKIAREEMLAGMREEMEARKNFSALQLELEALNNPAEKARQQLTERLGVIMEFYGLENEAQALQYEAGAAAEQAYQDVLNEIEAKAADDRIRNAERERQTKLAITQGMFSNLAQLMNTGSRKMFEIGKAASIANALVSGYEAVVSSYAVGSRIGGPPVGAAFAATAAAATMAQIQQIKGASFSKGAGGAGMSFQGGQSSMNTNGDGGAGPQQPGRNISISLTGSSFGAGGIRDLIAQINDAIGDGVAINVSGGG